MREGSGLVEFSRRFPDRYFDVAIAEQHAVTLAAGMACEGLRPVVAIYSTFLQRGYDQLIHDVALQNLPVTFAIDRGGLVGGDGATHQGAFDLSYLRAIPNMIVMTPADEDECRQMLFTAVTADGPAAVRYPRGQGPGIAIRSEMNALPIGRGELRREGRSGLAILSFGALLEDAARLAEHFDATLANMRFVKPLDAALVADLARRHGALVTVEDNAIAGGAGSAVLEALQAAGLQCPLLQLGIPDRFIEHGSREENLVDAGLDFAGLLRAVEGFWRPPVPQRRVVPIGA
jgi:1-deoxy-D-xylulose-5-phosphate synthase